MYLRTVPSGLGNHIPIRRSAFGKDYTASYVPSVQLCPGNSRFGSDYPLNPWNFKLKSNYNIYNITIKLLKLYITILTLTAIILITLFWLQNNVSCSFCNWPDDVIKLFTINEFFIIRLQPIWYTAYSSSLFFLYLRWIKSKSSLQIDCLFSPFSFFSSLLIFFHDLFIPYCNSAVCLAVLFLEIITETIWN